MTLRLFIANKNYSSWSLRPWVLMTHLGLDFEEVLVPFGPDSAQAFRAFSPTGKVPCLADGTTLVWDSLAIVEHLAERVGAGTPALSDGAVWPHDRTARAWARSASAEMHSGFGAVRHHCPMNCAVRVRLHPLAPAQAAELKAQWARIDELWCEGLRRFGGPFLTGGSFTAADAFYAPMAFRAQSYAPALSEPAQAYVRRLLDLPAMRRWYEQALGEPWRDEPHEAEIRALGEILSDARRSTP